MAQAQQAQRSSEVQEIQEIETKSKYSTSSSGAFKFNAHAPEFVPRSHAQTVPLSGYFHPCYHYIGANGGAEWIYVADQDSIPLVANSNATLPNYYPKDVVLNEGLQQKIIKQVEYQFSDLSLLANENLVKHINKDPKGFVSISFLASTKKLNSLIGNNHHLLAQALRASSKLEVSSDGKKVKRKMPFTDKEREELQSRTVVAENLPDNHSHQNIEKIFKVAGSVKAIRICHPQESGSSRSKGEYFISNKLHALIEYENAESADRAADKLNDERNWRKGLRVRLLLRPSPKSVLKSRKSDFDDYLDDDDDHEEQLTEALEDCSQPKNSVSGVDNNAEESTSTPKKGWAKGSGKSRQRTQSHNGRGLLSQPLQSNVCSIQGEQFARNITKGPRMPDGTKGFNMGRGKPLTTTTPLQSVPAV